MIGKVPFGGRFVKPFFGGPSKKRRSSAAVQNAPSLESDFWSLFSLCNLGGFRFFSPRLRMNLLRLPVFFAYFAYFAV
jgi:hypothetical protein